MTKNALGLPFVWNRISRAFPKRRDPESLRSRAVGVQFSAEENEAVHQAAAHEDRAVASFMRRVVLEWLKAEGYLK
jgi:hypothetical protein